MILYITSNKDKVDVANRYLKPHNIKLIQKNIELEEIQSNNIEEVALHKAEHASSKINQPFLINDAGWKIPSLNGFPGPYMKYINTWFTEKDLLRLVKNTDRKIIYHEVFVFKNDSVTKVFRGSVKGILLDEPEGNGILTWRLVSLRSDRKSIAKAWEENLPSVEDYPVWKEFAQWYKSNS